MPQSKASVPQIIILHNSDGSSCIIGFNPQKDKHANKPSPHKSFQTHFTQIGKKHNFIKKVIKQKINDKNKNQGDA